MISNTENCLPAGHYSGTVTTLRRAGGLIAGATAYVKETSAQNFHYHENPHMTFVLQGGNIENRRGASTELKVGEIVFYHSGEWHQTLPAADYSRNINLEIEEAFLKTFDITETALNRAVRQNPDSKFLLLKMYKEMLADDLLTGVSIQMLLLGIIKNPSAENKQRPPWVGKLGELLNDHWNEAHTLADLSAALQIHPVTISRYFPKHFGCTLGAYIRKIRIEKSITLLRQRHFSLTETALECGFSDQSHFTRNFKTLTGFLPGEFQRL